MVSSQSHSPVVISVCVICLQDDDALEEGEVPVSKDEGEIKGAFVYPPQESVDSTSSS